MTATTTALRARQRAREQRLAGARDRRLRLDPDRLAREQCIDEATIDIQDAWQARDQAHAAAAAAEDAAAHAIDRLLAQKLTIAEISQLTGLELPTLRRLRRLKPRIDGPSTRDGT